VHPEYFDATITWFFQRVARSVTPDTWVIAISESTKKDVCATLGVPPEQVWVAPLAADPSMFFPCDDIDRIAGVRRKNHVPDGPYLLSICTLEPRKNLDSVVRSFCDAVRRFGIPDLSLVLVGAKGWMTGRLEDALAAAGELRSRIVLCGYVPDAELAALYSGAMGFMYLSEYEGFGLPPLEAMQCGVPVIASDTSSLPEVVGDAGILVAPRDAAAQVEAIVRLHREPGLRQELSRRSIARAAMFSWDRCVEQVVRAYRCSMERTTHRHPGK
jgi:glycosyltransferase involved in cell wall biosynthesis